jgi:hypothetical protein
LKIYNDHTTWHLLIPPVFLKLIAEIIYRLYGREDIALSFNSFKLCNLTPKIFNMNLIEKHDD